MSFVGLPVLVGHLSTSYQVVAEIVTMPISLYDEREVKVRQAGDERGG